MPAFSPKSRQSGRDRASVSTSTSDVTGLRQGQHVCLFYRDPVEQLSVLAPFVTEGLARGERAVCLVEERTVDELAAGLARSGLDVAEAAGRRALMVRAADDVYLRAGRFSPEEMLELLGVLMEETLADGFSGLRVTGEMTWALGDEPGCERLIEYESMLTAFSSPRPALGLCQYNINRFPAALVHGALRTHRHVLFEQHVCPSPFFGSHVESIEWMLRQMARSARLENGAGRSAARSPASEHRLTRPEGPDTSSEADG